MSPVPDSDHEYIVDLLNRWSGNVLPANGVLVRVQNSVGIPELDSVPVPDLAWVIERDYRRQRPSAEDVLLLIEVAKTTLRYDRGTKAKLYAKAGIRDYWIVNVVGECVEVLRDPGKRGYADPVVYERGEKIKPLKMPKLSLAVDDLFK
jgi:Uma2 family endonuclease